MLDVHKELAALIEMRDAAGARRLMDDHVKMIARPPRRGAPRQSASEASLLLNPIAADEPRTTIRGRRRNMAKEKFIIEPHFRLQEWVAEEKGYFKDEGLDYIFQELIKSTDGAHHYKGDKVGAMQAHREGPHLRRELRLPLDGRRRRLEGQGPALRRRLFGRAGRRVRAEGLAGAEAGGSRRRADRGRLPVGQPLLDHPGARAVHAGRQDQPHLRRRHAVPPPGHSCSTARRRPRRCSRAPTTSPSSSASAR